MKRIYQELRTTNDTNGNPRRLTVVYSPFTGETLHVMDQGHYGNGIPGRLNHNFNPDQVVLPVVNITPAEYRAWLKGAKDNGTLWHGRVF